MEQQYDYKNDINSTRKGCLGGSDANLLSQVASLENVPRSAYKRLAVAKGLIENDNITTRVMAFGDFIENAIYSLLSEKNDGYISNPLWVSGKYSTKDLKLICHPDFALYDEEKKVLNVYECKATRFSVEQTRDTYKNQLFIEWTLANEIVKSKGDGWKVNMFLCHYNTDGVNIDDEFEFDPERLTVHRLRMKDNLFDIVKAMSITSDFMQTFDYYSDEDEIQAQYLPEKVKAEFDAVSVVLSEIKEREKTVDEFKARMTDFMQQKSIKSIKSEDWSITLVAASESVQFDHKKFLADLSDKHPRKAKKLRKDYEKRVTKGAYVQIKLSKKDNNN